MPVITLLSVTIRPRDLSLYLTVQPRAKSCWPVQTQTLSGGPAARMSSVVIRGGTAVANGPAWPQLPRLLHSKLASNSTFIEDQTDRG